MKKTIKSKEPIKKKCPHCNHEFWGFGMQVEHNLAVHIMSKHKDVIKEVKNDSKIRRK